MLFASAAIDYDYIMKLIADFSAKKPGKATMSREQLIGLIQSDAKFIDEREDITEYVINSQGGRRPERNRHPRRLRAVQGRQGRPELADIAAKHGLPAAALQGFVDAILARRIFDGEQLTELLAPLKLGWKARTQKELA